MAIFHCSIKITSRGKGRSAVAAAAYRAGEKIVNDYDGQSYDYTRKADIIHKEILLPDHAPKEYFDRTTLWNAVERIESNRNSQLAREVQLGLQVELSMEQNITIVHEYVKKHFVSKGMCADICIHDKDGTNPHAHVLLTIRPIESNGSWEAKSYKEYILDDNGERIKLPSGEFKSRKVYTTDWNDQTKAEEWRKGWADAVNAEFERLGMPERIDHRSYERQGVPKVPTVHLGVAASQMERKGIRTDRGDINRQAEVKNNQIRQLRARIRKAKDWLYAQPLTDTPSMMNIMGNITGGEKLKNRWQSLRDLKLQAKMLIFLQENNITDMAQLVDKVTKINEEFYEVSNSIKKIERRLDTLELHLANCDIHKQHRAVYQQYQQLPPKKQDVFCDKHFEEIQAYEAAKKYLADVLNGRKSLPIKEWQTEQKKLSADKFALCEDYYRLQDEVRSVEILRKSAVSLLREEASIQRLQTQNQVL